jgi:hypothetical protein
MKAISVLAAVICQLLLFGCDSLSQERKSTLTREIALNILNKYSDTPGVLRKNLYSAIRTYAIFQDGEIEQTRTRRGLCPTCDAKVDYFDFLNALAHEGILKPAPHQDATLKGGLFGDGAKTTMYAFSVIPQMDVEDIPGRPSVPGSASPALRYRIATQRFVRVTGIQQTGNQAIVDVLVSQEATAITGRMWNAAIKNQKDPLLILQQGNVGCQDCVSVPIRPESVKKMPFTKYDDGWRLGY